MSISLKCDNCGGITDDFCPICNWELCMECREKVLESRHKYCPNCGNHNWPLYQRENQETQEAAAKGLQKETEETIQKNNDSNPV